LKRYARQADTQDVSGNIDTDIVKALRRHLRVLEREIVWQFESETSCCGVTLTQCHAMLELEGREPLSLSALARALDLDKSTLSRTVEGMVSAGICERVTNPADRRAVRLSLTCAGRKRLLEINKACNRHYEALLNPLSDKRRTIVVEAIELLGDAMRRARLDYVRKTPKESTCRTPNRSKKL
jgi:DNA-binding MarR family transcriptional regulator